MVVEELFFTGMLVHIEGGAAMPSLSIPGYEGEQCFAMAGGIAGANSEPLTENIDFCKGCARRPELS